MAMSEAAPFDFSERPVGQPLDLGFDTGNATTPALIAPPQMMTPPLDAIIEQIDHDNMVASQSLPDTDCEGKPIPMDLLEPVCFQGDWIEHSWLEEPDFWACGRKPSEMNYPVCNHETGQWQEVSHFNENDDLVICGPYPKDGRFKVCNHQSLQWEDFHGVGDIDFEVCGLKPANMGISVCNHLSGKWEPVGPVHPPQLTKCGPRPLDMSTEAVCDSETG